jgi:HD superfamily phosphohydrolase
VNEAGDGLAITSKGRTAAEMMVFARYVMFTEVYWHHAVRSATTMFATCIFGIAALHLECRSVFRMSESDLIRCLCEAAGDSDVASLMNGLFGQRRQLHKRLAEYSIYHQEPLYRALRRIDATQLADMFAPVDRKTWRRCRRARNYQWTC